jgi:acetoin utilization deacetylase AcuC-like enzyme
LEAFYTDHFVLPLPPGHRFPMSKYRMLRDKISAALTNVTLNEPPEASDGQLALAHTPSYIDRLVEGKLSSLEQRALGFPWSPAMVVRSRRSTGATIAACRAALASRSSAVNLAGGTHHAFADRAEGFCCFNDVAVAARLMQAERRAKRILILDLDVHQGNGTANILANDDSVFTASIHGANNYPFRKELSHLDIGLPDGTDDLGYEAALNQLLAQIDSRFNPDFMIYLAGADIYIKDRLGKLAVSIDGISRRDQLVFDWAKQRALPVAIAMGGGYCPQIDDTVQIHFNTVALFAKYSLDLS